MKAFLLIPLLLKMVKYSPKAVLSLFAIIFTICSLQANPLVRMANEEAKDSMISSTPSLSEVLNPDGTIRPGAQGSFTATGYHIEYTADRKLRFCTENNAFNCNAQWGSGFNLSSANGLISSVAVLNNNIYVGGQFTTIGSQAISYLAMWTGSAWKSIGQLSTSGFVWAFAVSGSKLYIGGQFTTVNGTACNRLAVWDGTTLSPVTSAASTNGVSATVYSLSVSGNLLYVGGNKMTADGISNYFLSFNTSTNTWAALGDPTDYALNGAVKAIAVSGNNVYVGGQFNTFGNGTTVNGIVVWNTSSTTWSTLTSGGGTGVTDGNGNGGYVSAIAITGNNVYVGGIFTEAGTSTASEIAVWNQSTQIWSSLTDGNTGIEGVAGGTGTGVFALTIANNKLYVGGYFNTAGGNAGMNNVAIWDGLQWRAMGSGTATSTATATNAAVYAFATNGSSVYTAGQFNTAGSTTVNRIAVWNGSWAALDPVSSSSGNGLNAVVNAVAVSGNNIFVGGSFTLAGNGAVNYVAMWNGSTWSNMGGGVSSTSGTASIQSLAINGNTVYVGGSFDKAGGVSVLNIAAWNMQTNTWSALGSGLGVSASNVVYALALDNAGNLYAGGNFTFSGSTSIKYFAEWDGSTWTATGGGVSNEVHAIAVSGANVYVGGYFNTVGSAAKTAPYLAVWNGSAWNNVGSSAGATSYVYAIAVSAAGYVYIGGSFTSIGGVTAYGVAYWDGSAWHAMGTANGTNNTVYSLAVNGNSVYATGAFTTIGGTSANYTALWNGSSWKALGSGLNASGQTIVSDGSQLYIGGFFTMSGGVGSNYFNTYKPGPCWVGGTSTAWETPSNWDDGTGPQTGGSAWIPSSGVTNEPAVNSNPMLTSLSIQTGRTLTVSSGNILGITNSLTNDATITGSGVVALTGTSNQIVSGAGKINNITINNSAGVTLNSNHTITNNLSFTNGKITMNSNDTLVFADGATISGASSAAYVNGAITKMGSQAFVFPLGSSTQYAPIAISAPSSSSIFSASYAPANPQAVYSSASIDPALSTISNTEYWILNRLSGAGNVTLILYWDAARSSSITNTAGTRVAGLVSNVWQDMGNTHTTGTTTSGTVQSNAALSSYGAFTIGGEPGALPLTLLSFSAQAQNNNIALLNWQTTNEINTSVFDIERCIPGGNFTTVGSVNAMHIGSNSYSFKDDISSLGSVSIINYRLKMIDIGGHLTYSKIVSIVPIRQADLNVYPNPIVRSSITIDVGTAFTAPLIYSIYDISGRAILQGRMVSSSMIVNVSTIAAGTYWLQISNGQGVKIVKP